MRWRLTSLHSYSCTPVFTIYFLSREGPAVPDVYLSWRTGLSDRPSCSCVCSCPGWAGTGPGSPPGRSRRRTCGWSWSLRRLWPGNKRFSFKINLTLSESGRKRDFSVTRLQDGQHDELVDGEQRDLEHGHDQQLDRAGFTQDGAE